MRILCIGDVVGKPGRRALEELLPDLVRRRQIQFVVANAENASGGVGLTAATAKDLLALPVDVYTAGNHIWKYKDIVPVLEREERLLRPLNYPPGTPGRGAGVFRSRDGVAVGLVNVLGRVFMEPLSCPFTAALEATAALKAEARVTLVEIHAEATSEKRALGWHLSGKVSAVYGTHTHVLTADEEVLPGGTGYITDLGMTGPYRSVIGMRTDGILQRFLTQRPTPMMVAAEDIHLCGAIFDVDEATGRATSVERVDERIAS